MAGKTVVVLGAGVGGAVVARELRKRVGGDHRIVLVDQRVEQPFAPSFPWIVLGWRQPHQITRRLPRLLGSGIEFVQGQVEGIDSKAGKVKTSSGELSYDYLVVALGADMAYQAVPGLFPAAHSFYELDQAVRLRDALASFQGGRVAILIAGVPYKCPAAPHEAAMLLDYHFRRRGLRQRVEVNLFTPEPQPMPVAGSAVGGPVQRLYQERGVGFHPGHRLNSIDAERRELRFDNGQTASYDLLIAIPPHRCPALVQEAGLTDARGWVPVDRFTLKAQQAEATYALGDVTIIPLPSGLPLPKAGVFARSQAKVVAKNLAAELTGKDGDQFKGEGS
ncbi:MAG: NAD(P)/FAD-dependent oxidoreductase [Chloroflexi bacterium]|nr:NAD(P)/FAD-dependent oxidoreductase [Chloroflexota bacterium]